MTTGGNRVLVDTNVLVYSTVKSCPKFQEARAWLDQMFKRGDSLVIIPQIIREYLVVLTRGKIFTETFTIDQALREIEAILKTVVVLDETVQVAEQLWALVRKHNVQGKSVHDANLVAGMLTYGVQRLATYNTADFKRFTEITMEPTP
jgi:toxin-antitoxin system PIN domain toxin